jgi:ATP-dependent Clp protease ATP-binding subunit ClpA
MEPLSFTPRSQQVLLLARQAADHMRNNYVGTEHLLIGLIELGQYIAVNMLKKLNVTLDAVNEWIRKALRKHIQGKNRFAAALQRRMFVKLFPIGLKSP